MHGSAPVTATGRRSPTSGSSTCSTVVAGPGCGPLPRRLRRRRDQGRATRRRRRPARDGLARPARRTSLWWKLVGRNKRCDRARPQGPRRPRRMRGLSTPPTCSSRTSGPARSSGSASAPDDLLAAQPAAGGHPGDRLRPGRSLRQRGPASPRWPRRCRASPPSTASPTAARCSRRSRSPTRSPRSSPPSPRWSPLHSRRRARSST